jgi:hypothetical protein
MALSTSACAERSARTVGGQNRADPSIPLRKDPDVLESPCHALVGYAVGRQTDQVLAHQPGESAAGPEHPRDQVEDGGLARSVGPDHADDLSLRHLQIQPVHGRQSPKPHGEPAQLEHRRPYAHFFSSVGWTMAPEAASISAA